MVGQDAGGGSAEHAFNYYTVAQVGVVAIECPQNRQVRGDGHLVRTVLQGHIAKACQDFCSPFYAPFICSCLRCMLAGHRLPLFVEV